jgi:hypothetical protein
MRTLQNLFYFANKATIATKDKIVAITPAAKTMTSNLIADAKKGLNGEYAPKPTVEEIIEEALKDIPIVETETES